MTPPKAAKTPAAAYGTALTEREHEVLIGMARGQSNLAIGEQLFISEDTVKTHARRVFAKLGAVDRAHAVAIGCHGGLIPAPDGTAPLAAPTPFRQRNGTELRIPAVLAEDVIAVITRAAAGHMNITLRDHARQTLTALRDHTGRTIRIPSPRTGARTP